MLPHEGYQPAVSQHFAIARSCPLIAVAVDKHIPVCEPIFRVTPEDILIQAMKPLAQGKALLIRLFNSSGVSRKVQIRWPGLQQKRMYRSNLFTEKGKPLHGSFMMSPFGLVTIIGAIKPD